ncbi:hypothetical protein GCM10010377_78760 [Streptomyces viridiviolaceus]|nr:hypothetical protein GCM10010377_78760 [Streptomyces viridiviolaceus]
MISAARERDPFDWYPCARARGALKPECGPRIVQQLLPAHAEGIEIGPTLLAQPRCAPAAVVREGAQPDRFPADVFDVLAGHSEVAFAGVELTGRGEVGRSAHAARAVARPPPRSSRWRSSSPAAAVAPRTPPKRNGSPLELSGPARSCLTKDLGWVRGARG